MSEVGGNRARQDAGSPLLAIASLPTVRPVISSSSLWRIRIPAISDRFISVVRPEIGFRLW
jgi:hypothetical protein